MKTSVRASFELTEEGILDDANISTTSNSSFADISKLKTNVKDYTPFMTLEHNINILDGTLDIYDSSNIDLSYFSQGLSSESRISNNEIVVQFSKNHSIYGIALGFGVSNFLDEIEIDYYNASNLIKSYSLYPNVKNYTPNAFAESFNKIIIKFKSTRFPRMFSRLQYLNFGKIYNWDDEIISCNVTENINPISKEIKVNTCQLTVYSDSDDFNMLDPNSAFLYLRKNQKINIYATCDGTEYQFGMFFLDSWDASVKNVATFKLISPIGILSRILCYDGWICLNPLPDRVGDTTYSALKKIFDNYTSDIYSNLSYSVSSDLTTPLFGVIPLADYRKIFQVITFCSCAAVNDTRDGIIKISRIINNESSITITLNDILDEIKISRNELPTIMELHYYYYYLTDGINDDKDYKELCSLELTSGVKTKITSSKPISWVRYKTTSSSQWTQLTDFNLYYFYFTPSETNTYVFQFIEQEFDNTNFENFDLSDKINQVENVIKIDNEPLIFRGVDDNGNNSEFVENIKSYYNNVPFTAEFEFINNGTVKTGDVITVETDLGQKIKGYLIEQNINLSGGMISKAKVIGDVISTDEI